MYVTYTSYWGAWSIDVFTCGPMAHVGHPHNASDWLVPGTSEESE